MIFKKRPEKKHAPPLIVISESSSNVGGGSSSTSNNELSLVVEPLPQEEHAQPVVDISESSSDGEGCSTSTCNGESSSTSNNELSLVVESLPQEEHAQPLIDVSESSSNGEGCSTSTYNGESSSTSNDELSFVVESLPNEEGLVKDGTRLVGPWGDDGWCQRSPFDDGVFNGIRKLVVGHGAAIDSIQIDYDDNGSLVRYKHGGLCGPGPNISEIELDYPNEVLTQISGFYGSAGLGGVTAVKSIKFRSTKGSYGPFGDEQGKCFSSGEEHRMIVGFHGNALNWVNRIGVHVLEATIPRPQPSLQFPLKTTDLKLGGPWGGEGGSNFDDGMFTTIRQLIVRHGLAITSIQIDYDNQGNMERYKHGGNGGRNINKIALEYPYEVLTGISGYYGSSGLGGITAVKSLTFYTTKCVYGPFGDEQGKYFSSGEGLKKIIGFHGKSGIYIDSIGIHYLEGSS